ncbi:hypothetical protein L227DRAFT_147093 [Lentinus tigrinus ALCF2SS1-6]|uniref:HSF-type DNA-binding domain-containing protein n=1 Tax=Lentinus tigrinus ALCF2SS1-6 TaxID=1328759 RepID=A0A5C2STT5_9APHY|nr:hypothetical protein L227DRAFT_147093 [Lentinus tigrinus ALCF2SS1-6]
MSLDTQVALARPPRGESSHLSRAARQVVPPFLQKLYEIVNDPANEELIKWSENGDSFYVLNHEKFAREVLGRWFKHQKFASFVRQLNMYGFHKIPHLQQGVLKSDSDTEPWHFEHPNFHRGQPDLLCLIQRKKQPTHGQPDDPAIDMHDPANSPNPLTNVTPGHLMDINSIVNGVAAIKRHQQAISADLSTLKQSNDALWKEAVAARQRHAKHQDTINRILKFLAGVFGHTDDGPHSPDGSHTPPQVTPRIRQRLMIGDIRRSPLKGKSVDIMEVEDDEVENRRINRGPSPFSDRYASIETPDATVTTPSGLESIAPSEAFSPASDVHSDKSSPPIRPSQVLSRSNSATSASRLTNVSTPLTNGSTPNPVQTTPASAPPPANVDAMWQAAIQHMMSSPGQFQRLMQAFANQQSIANLPGNLPTDPNLSNTHASAIAAYEPNANDYSRWFTPSAPSTSSATMSQPLLAPAHSDENNPLQLLLDESNRLQKSYRDATEIDADMDMLQSSINSLIQNLGIDPTSLAQPHEEPVPPMASNPPNMNGQPNGPPPQMNGFAMHLPPESFVNGFGGMNGLDPGGADASQPDHLLDSLLSQIGDGAGGGGAGVGMDGMDGMPGYPDITDHYDHSARIDGTSIDDASTEQLAAFLEEASANSGADSPPGGVGVNMNVNGSMHQKRKSDAMDLPLPTPPEGGTGKKVKRKR